MKPIRIAIAGVGNCASSLVQGVAWYAAGHGPTGLMHPLLGGYGVGDIRVVAAIDVDRRKVGRPLEEAIFAPPNNTRVFCSDLPASGVTVEMGPVLDGVPPHMAGYPSSERFEPSDSPPVDVVRLLRDRGAQVLVNYMPVGARKAAEFYAQACLDAGVALVNCMPVFIASDRGWAARFARAGLPVVGDDIKAQVGATITHRTLARLMEQRGVRIENTYQLNVGGNSDFLNMLARERLCDKRTSKTEAVNSQLDEPLEPGRIHIGPADYVPFLRDNKVCFLRLEGVGFGGVPMHIELRLSVEDSPNSAGVVVDAIRAAKIALDRGLAGPIEQASAYLMKRPPRQMSDDEARWALESFCGEPR